MLGQASENHRKITVVKKQKKNNSGYPKSDGVRSEKQWECKDVSNYLMKNTILMIEALQTLKWLNDITFELVVALPNCNACHRKCSLARYG